MEKIKLAFAAPLTGDQSVVAVPMLKAIELAVENLKPEGIEVEVAGFDDKADLEEAAKVAWEIAKDRDIIAVIGNKNSGALEAAGSIYNKAGISFITPSATNYGLSQNGWKGFFRLCANDKAQSHAAAKFAYDELGLRKMCIAHDGTGYGMPLGLEFRDYAEELGINVDMVRLVPCGTKDVKALVSEIKNSDVEGIYFALTEIESSIMARELAEQKASQIMLGTDGSPNSKFPALAGKSAEGAYMTYAGALLGKNKISSEFMMQYKEKYGELPVYSVEIYDAVSLVMKAVKNRGASKREQIADCIRLLTPLEGASGIIDFDEFGNRRNQEVSLWKWTRGNMKYIKSIGE